MLHEPLSSAVRAVRAHGGEVAVRCTAALPAGAGA
jgi:hypothetical protein